MKNEHNPTTIAECVHFVDGRWYVAHMDRAGNFWSYRKKDRGIWRGSGTHENAVPDGWGYSYVSKSAAVKRAIEVYGLEEYADQ